MNKSLIAAIVIGLGLISSVAGCISAAPSVPVTPANSAQVSACQAAANGHNDFSIAGIALGGSASVVAGVAGGVASSDSTTAKDMGITAAAMAGSAAVLEALAGYYASDFSAQQCGQYVGPLAPLPPLSKLDSGITVTPPSTADAGTE
jgi:hypothetical protein